jgi:hypothetical protein
VQGLVKKTRWICRRIQRLGVWKECSFWYKSRCRHAVH